MICHYLFFNNGFKFQDYVCNVCHYFTMLCIDINNITIISVKNVYHRCIIHNIRKSGASDLLKNSVLEDRGYIEKILPYILTLFKAIFLPCLFGYT